MNNFIFENATKTIFGKGCVKEYLAGLTRPYDTILQGKILTLIQGHG